MTDNPRKTSSQDPLIRFAEASGEFFGSIVGALAWPFLTLWRIAKQAYRSLRHEDSPQPRPYNYIRLGFGPKLIGPGEKFEIEAKPDFDMVISRLIVPSTLGIHFAIRGIRIGDEEAISLMIDGDAPPELQNAIDGIPAVCFSENAVEPMGAEPIGECKAGQTVVLRGVNLSDQAVMFAAIMGGENYDPPSSPAIKNRALVV